MIAIQTWVRNNDKTRYAVRAEEREKNIGRIGRLFTAWRVSHAEREESGRLWGEAGAPGGTVCRAAVRKRGPGSTSLH